MGILSNEVTYNEKNKYFIVLKISLCTNMIYLGTIKWISEEFRSVYIKLKTRLEFILHSKEGIKLLYFLDIAWSWVCFGKSKVNKRKYEENYKI